MEVSNRRAVAMLSLLALLALGAWVYLTLPPVTHTGTDIYYSYVEGQRIVAGENPYTRILGGNMRDNQKYPTYFPLFFLIAAGMQRLGLSNYEAWLAVLRWLLLPFYLGAGALLYYVLYRRRGLVLAALAVLVWFLNRWNLQIIQVANIDNTAILCLLLSLYLLDRRRPVSLLLLSLSLAFKHFGLFVAPLYLVVAWRDAAPGRRWRDVALAGLAIASLPLLLSLPFMFWPGHSPGENIMGLARSIFFSATRNAAAHVDAPSLDSLFGLTGFTARLPLFGLFLLVYAAFARRRLKLYAACFLVMVLLIDFNSVLFLQYFCWPVAFGLLAAAELGVESQPATCLRDTLASSRRNHDPGITDSTRDA